MELYHNINAFFKGKVCHPLFSSHMASVFGASLRQSQTDEFHLGILCVCRDPKSSQILLLSQLHSLTGARSEVEQLGFKFANSVRYQHSRWWLELLFYNSPKIKNFNIVLLLGEGTKSHTCRLVFFRCWFSLQHAIHTILLDISIFYFQAISCYDGSAWYDLCPDVSDKTR